MASIQSIVWDNATYPITQGFGVYNPGTAWMYDYASDHGWPSGTHIGVDVGVPYGTPIYAAESGKVTKAGFSDSFRPYPVEVKEDDGETAIYGHLSQNNVKTGDEVKRGQLLGKSGEQTFIGTTIPDSTGPHIHFELRDESGKAIDPIPELSGTGETSSGVLSSLAGWNIATRILIGSAAAAVVLFGVGMLR